MGALEYDVTTDIADVSNPAKPEDYVLGCNYPNPFNPVTTIGYRVPGRNRVRIMVYDACGRHVRTLVDAWRPTGLHNVMWDGRNETGRQMASGVYFYQMTSGDYVQTRRMLLMK
jgi:hypothetical protein